jgi:hypothetical protein
MPIIGRGDSAGLVGESAIVYPTAALLFHLNSVALTGNAITSSLDGSQIFFTYAVQNPSANLDSFTHPFVLQAGSYTLMIRGITKNDQGLLDLYFKHVSDPSYTALVAGQDWYSAVLTQNVTKSVSLTVVKPGLHILKGVVNGKNAASSAYVMRLTYFRIRGTAD